MCRAKAIHPRSRDTLGPQHGWVSRSIQQTRGDVLVLNQGTRLLKQLLGQFGGDVPLALGAAVSGVGGYVTGNLSDMGKN